MKESNGVSSAGLLRGGGNRVVGGKKESGFGRREPVWTIWSSREGEAQPFLKCALSRFFEFNDLQPFQLNMS